MAARGQPLKILRKCGYSATIAGVIQIKWNTRNFKDGRGGVYERELRVAVRAQERGGYTYQIFTVASEPRTLLEAKDDHSYASPAEAARAGFEAVAVLKCISADLI